MGINKMNILLMYGFRLLFTVLYGSNRELAIFQINILGVQHQLAPTAWPVVMNTKHLLSNNSFSNFPLLVIIINSIQPWLSSFFQPFILSPLVDLWFSPSSFFLYDETTSCTTAHNTLVFSHTNSALSFLILLHTEGKFSFCLFTSVQHRVVSVVLVATLRISNPLTALSMFHSVSPYIHVK